MWNLEKAKTNPSMVFSSPQQVVDTAELAKEDKVAILRQWEYDMREMEVAEEENMKGNDTVTLYDVLDALHQIAPDAAQHQEAHFTKQGG